MLLSEVNCRLRLAGLGRINRGKFEANLLYVESESDFGATAGKSFTVFFARGGVEFDRWVKISAR